MSNTPPKDGYILTLWNLKNSYRATALAYMERENIKQVENKDGKNYFINDIKKAITGNKL